MPICTKIIRAGVPAGTGTGAFRLTVPFPVGRVRILSGSASSGAAGTQLLICQSSLFQNNDFAMVTSNALPLIIRQDTVMDFHTSSIINGVFDVRISYFDGTFPAAETLLGFVMQFES
jgi:hypothetical protein